MKSLPRLLLIALFVFLPGAHPASARAADPAGAEALLVGLKEHPAAIRAENLRVDLLLRAIGRQAGINIVVAENITETINLELTALSLYEVFNFIVETHQLQYRRQNNIILVEKRDDSQPPRQELPTARICARYDRAADYLDQLKPLLTPMGRIDTSGQSNCLIVRDLADNITKIEAMLEVLDRPVPQVHIEARIVTVTSEAKKRLGVLWGYDTTWKLDNKSPNNPLTFDADLGVVGATSNLAFGVLRDNFNLAATIQAMQEDNLLDLLSSPSILVLNGEAAEIKQGKEIPYVAQSGDLISTSFREATLSLRVTPQVLQDDFINLKVNVTNDSVDMVTGSSSSPLINKQEITTRLFLENGTTVVIGGILTKNKTNRVIRVPVLSAIPILGALFRGTSKGEEEVELMVFLTPTIVNLDGVRTVPLTARRAAEGEGDRLDESVGRESP